MYLIPHKYLDTLDNTKVINKCYYILCIYSRYIIVQIYLDALNFYQTM